MAVSGLGEFELIDRLAALVATSASPRLAVGIGDDAAAWAPEPNTVTVATADALVAGVHFDLATTSWADLGWKALAENVSDVAAMGCQPRYAIVALALPAETPLSGVEDLYRGMGECARAYGCTIAGGDVVRAPCMMLSVTVIGESTPVAHGSEGDTLLRRSRAHAGDTIAVTGPLGGSAAGLRVLQARWNEATASEHERALVAIHRRPMPRVDAGRILVEAGVRCAIDVSDGLVADVGHICEQSGVDAELDPARVPIHPGAVACFKDDALHMALTGGEDYELVCAGPTAAIVAASARLIRQGAEPLTMIGSIVPRAGATPCVQVRRADGATLDVQNGGYRHF